MTFKHGASISTITSGGFVEAGACTKKFRRSSGLTLSASCYNFRRGASESEVQRLESEGRSKHTSVAGASTPGAFAGASTPAGFELRASSQRSAATVRECSNDRSRDHAASSECPRGRQERDPLDAVFEAKLEAIRSRSNSPAAHKAQAWLEYSQRKQAQAAEDREADWHPDLV